VLAFGSSREHTRFPNLTVNDLEYVLPTLNVDATVRVTSVDE
jgi:hypothetical protein